MAEYIERELALNKLKEELEFNTPMYTAEQNKYIDIGLKIAIKDIKSLPKADVQEVKHGRWIVNKSKVELEYRCSECGATFVEADPNTEIGYICCPYCTTLMDKAGVDNA